MVAALVLGAGLIVAGLGTIVLGFACRDGRLPLNGLVGIRIPSTTTDPETWIRAHRAAWHWITLAGAGPLASGLAIFVLQDESGLWVIAGALWLLGLIIGASVVASRAAALGSSES